MLKNVKSASPCTEAVPIILTSYLVTADWDSSVRFMAEDWLDDSEGAFNGFNARTFNSFDAIANTW